MSFKSDINKFTKKTIDKTEKVFRASALIVFGRIIKASPVGNPSLWLHKLPDGSYGNYLDYNDANGYVGGRFRANWQTSLNRPKTAEVNSTSSAISTVTANRVAKMADLGDTIWFVNNLPYAERLENGWSTQAPTGMVKRNIKGWNALVSRLARAQNK